MWKSLPTDYCTRLISWLCNDFVTLTTIIDFQGVRKDWNCPPIPEKKSEKTQNLSFSVWLLTRLFFLPSTDHKTLFCWSVPLGLPQASFFYKIGGKKKNSGWPKLGFKNQKKVIPAPKGKFLWESRFRLPGEAELIGRWKLLVTRIHSLGQVLRMRDPGR